MKKPTDSGRVDGMMGAGTVAGGGTTAMCERRLPGTTYLVVARARCRSACAFLAFRSLGFAGMFGSLGLKLKFGRAGLARTLAMKIAASAVTMTEIASHTRRTRRQRRPCGS